VARDRVAKDRIAKDHIIPVSHLDLDLTANSGQVFRWVKPSDIKPPETKVDTLSSFDEANTYVIPAAEHLAVVWQAKPDELHLYCEDADLDFWKRYFALDVDYDSIIRRLSSADTRLAEITRVCDGVRVLRQPLFETVATFMASQNNNIPRIKKNVARMCEGLTCPFPTPSELASRLSINDCGLGYRRQSILDMARSWDGLQLQLGKSYAEDKQTLMQVRGIGPKVADCICLFGLGHTEAYPVDTWMRKADAKYHFPLVHGIEGIEQQFVFTWMRLFARD